MSIIGTCGHTFSDNEGGDGFGTTIPVKDHTKDGSRAIGYPTVCDKCLEWYKKKKLVLETKEEQEKWLKGKKLFCEEVNRRKEYIICAAIHNPEEKDMAGNPLIYCGLRHANILWQGKQISRKLQHQGFITNKGRFVDRKEALKIAIKANQVNEEKLGNPRIGLFSEDLY